MKTPIQLARTLACSFSLLFTAAPRTAEKCCANDAAAAPTLSREDAAELFGHLIADPRRFLCGSNPYSFDRFQFQVWFYLQPRGETIWKPSYRMICETDGDRAAILVLTADGAPQAFIGPEAAFFVTPNEPTMLSRMPGLRFRFKCNSIGSVEFVLSGSLRESSCVLDLYRICHALVTEATITGFTASNAEFSFENPNGSTASIRFSRERSPLSYPVDRIQLSGATGKGVSFTGFLRGPRISRSILEFDKLIASNWPSDIQDLPLTTEAIGRVYPVNDAERWETANSSPSFRTISRTLSNMMAEQGITTHLQSLTELTADYENNQNYKNSQIRTRILDLREFFLDTAFWPVIAPSRNSRMWCVPGCDNSKTSIPATLAVGPANLRIAVDVFHDIATSESFDLEVRLCALDIIEFFGFDEPLIRYRDLRERLANDHNPWMRAAIAAASTRGDKTEAGDLGLLRKTLLDEEAPREIRQRALEALLLARNVNGLEDVAFEILASLNSADMNVDRCLMAAAIVPDGVRILLRLAESGAYSQTMILLLLRDHVGRDHAEFSEVSAYAKDVAFDTDAEPNARAWAAEIVARDTADIATRDLFVRMALESGEPILIRCAIVNFLCVDKSACEYLPQLRKAVLSCDVTTRERIVDAIPLCIPKDPAPEFRSAIGNWLRDVALECGMQTSAARVAERVGVAIDLMEKPAAIAH